MVPVTRARLLAPRRWARWLSPSSLVAVLLMRDDGSMTYKLRFQNAGQLVKDDDVQIGGRRVGTIDKIDLTSTNEAEVEVSLQKEFAPLHAGTRALIRATSLSGIANRYIALTPGTELQRPSSTRARSLKADLTTAPVDLDQLFNTLDQKTRDGLAATSSRASRPSTPGRRPRPTTRPAFFTPALSSTQRLVNELTRDQHALTSFLVDSSKLVTAIAERRDDLSSLVGNANATTAAIASENVSLDSALERPARHAAQGQHDVRQPALHAGRPRRRSSTRPSRRPRTWPASCASCGRCSPRRARRSPICASWSAPPGPNNDLIDLPRRSSRASQQVATPTFRRSITALKDSQPVLEFIRPYAPELIGLAARLRPRPPATTTPTATSRASQPIVNAFSFADNGWLHARPRRRCSSRGLQSGIFRRCPGAATPAPRRRLRTVRRRRSTSDCDPSQVLPGP